MRYDCKQAPLNHLNISNAWWQDRHDELHFYWSGDGDLEEEMDYEGYCYCYNHDTCVQDSVKCNCDAGSELWSSDDGQLTDRRHLPVTKLNFGNLDAEGQEARFQLGPLYCGGHSQESPGSCSKLWSENNIVSGYHMVKGLF